MADMWTQDEAIALCSQIEQICPDYGCHVALTGGTLYKGGMRKDLDILFYRIRQVPEIDIDGLFAALLALSIVRVTERHQWCMKAIFGDKKIDCFFPEEQGEYPASGICEFEPEFVGME
jgi:hypothetical protein